MISSKERATQFKNELKELLKKWNTEIALQQVENSKAYYKDKEMVVYLEAIYENNDCVAEFSEIKFGSYIDPD